MSKIWKLKKNTENTEKVEIPGLSPLLSQLLLNREILGTENVYNFLNPDFEKQFDPYLFRDMEISVSRIWKAINEDETIAVYGDYDCDAVTASSVLFQVFKYLNVKIINYIPDRFEEGYGLNIPAFQNFKKQGVSIVITVDCGTNSVDVAKYCKEVGIDLIITDHHEITGDVPKAFSLINPKNPDDTYPEHQITGVGVAYKLARALLLRVDEVEKRVTNPVKDWDKWLLDLVAIGTVADCHSLVGENRILVSFGLKVLLKTRWPGLRALLNLIPESGKLNSETLGFAIAPRINAAGRLKHANLALECLIEENPEKATLLANELEKINDKRKEMTARILSEAREMAELYQDRKVLVLAHESWHKGLVGIVAGKLTEEYAKPVVVLEKGDREATGSVRSYGNFNTVGALKYAHSELLKYGGHKEAAGLTLNSDNIDNFWHKLLAFADEESTEPKEDSPELELEMILSENEVNLSTVSEIKRLEPFGSGNPLPRFLIEDAIVATTKLIGKDQTHLAGTFQLGERLVEAVGFGLGYMQGKLQVGQKVSLAVELIEDFWLGRRKLKLRILDVKFK